MNCHDTHSLWMLEKAVAPEMSASMSLLLLVLARVAQVSRGRSNCAGNWHYTADGQRISYSLVNNAASDFSIPPQYNAIKLLHNNTLKGYDAASDYNPQTSHFLGLCMKVVYEKELVIKVRAMAPLPVSCSAAASLTKSSRPLQRLGLPSTPVKPPV